MLQLVCEIFLALVLVFLLYPAFRRLLKTNELTDSLKKEESKAFERDKKKNISKKR